MAGEWDEVMLWVLAEKLSERIDAIRAEGVSDAKRKQRELALGPGGNVVAFADHPVVQRGRLRRCGRTSCVCPLNRSSRTPAPG